MNLLRIFCYRNVFCMHSKYSVFIKKSGCLNLSTSHLVTLKTVSRCSEWALHRAYVSLSKKWWPEDTHPKVWTDIRYYLKDHTVTDPFENDLQVLSCPCSSSADSTYLPHQTLSPGLRDSQSELLVSDMQEHGFSVHCQSVLCPEIGVYIDR